MKTLIITILFGAQAALSAATIVIPNGDFSSSGNNGSIQGTLLSGGASATPMGTGPWNVQTTGLAGLLLPPTATIGSGYAEVSGLLGLGVLGQSNTAQFYQTLAGQTYEPFTTYTLSATIVTSSAITLSILGNNGIGIALTSGGNANVVANSTSASLVTLSPLATNTYELTLQYMTTGTVPSGNVGVRLFSGFNTTLASGSLLGNVRFDNVTLTAIPEPASTALFLGGIAILFCAGARFRNGSATRNA